VVGSQASKMPTTFPDWPLVVRSALATPLDARASVGVRESAQPAWINAKPNTAMSGVRRMRLLLARVVRGRATPATRWPVTKPHHDKKVRADDAG
jgi:hypothetical protein